MNAPVNPRLRLFMALYSCSQTLRRLAHQNRHQSISDSRVADEYEAAGYPEFAARRREWAKRYRAESDRLWRAARDHLAAAIREKETL